jgi:hypothetical protein
MEQDGGIPMFMGAIIAAVVLGVIVMAGIIILSVLLAPVPAA